MADFIARTRKAWGAGMAAVAAVLYPRVLDGSIGNMQDDVSLALGPFVVAFVLVYFLPNKPAS